MVSLATNWSNDWQIGRKRTCISVQTLNVKVGMTMTGAASRYRKFTGPTPDRIGWTLLRRIVTPKRRESWSTSSRTSSLDVNMYANLSWNIRIRAKKTMPIMVDWTTETLVANLAPWPLPAPSSFATRTLRNSTEVRGKRSRNQVIFHSNAFSSYSLEVWLLGRTQR